MAKAGRCWRRLLAGWQDNTRSPYISPILTRSSDVQELNIATSSFNYDLVLSLSPRPSLIGWFSIGRKDKGFSAICKEKAAFFGVLHICRSFLDAHYTFSFFTLHLLCEVTNKKWVKKIKDRKSYKKRFLFGWGRCRQKIVSGRASEHALRQRCSLG